MRPRYHFRPPTCSRVPIDRPLHAHSLTVRSLYCRSYWACSSLPLLFSVPQRSYWYYWQFRGRRKDYTLKAASLEPHCSITEHVHPCKLFPYSAAYLHHRYLTLALFLNSLSSPLAAGAQEFKTSLFSNPSFPSSTTRLRLQTVLSKALSKATPSAAL